MLADPYCITIVSSEHAFSRDFFKNRKTNREYTLVTHSFTFICTTVTLYSTRRNVTHRDIKSYNILVGGAAGKDLSATPPVVKLADFGTSKYMGGQDVAASGLKGTHVYSQSI